MEVTPIINLEHTGEGGKFAPIYFLFRIAKEITLVTQDETLYRFTFHICEDSYNLLCEKSCLGACGRYLCSWGGKWQFQKLKFCVGC